MDRVINFTAMTKLQLVMGKKNKVCFGIESDSKGVTANLEESGVYLVESYLNVIAAGFAAVIQESGKADAEKQAAYVKYFHDMVENWLAQGLEIVENPETRQQPGSPG